ncbi:SMP-30/gluconolactonase/LRE family protein [Paenibacillus shunpengii]|uniref:Regucalcin n=1 Tax=Paenibacillus shunpengii TaxID=2054424 RepID=A0ABW5SLT7_9BACL
MTEVELVIDAKARLAEGPSWDAEEKRLYWVDIEGYKLHIYDPSSGRDTVHEVGQHIGAVVPYDRDRVMVALKSGFHRYDLASGKLTLLHNPESHRDDNRFNDGKCDPNGRFWAGTMSLTDKKNQGALYCLMNDGQIKTVLTEVSLSNGLGFSPDHKKMYYIDTPTGRIDQFDFDLDTGEISNRVTLFSLPEGTGFPDGLTVDAEGMIWVAHYGGSQVSRWDPNTGSLIQHIEVPASNVTSCCFGGEELDELYITTARNGLKEEQLLKTPHAGGVFRVKPGVKGQPTYRYKGIK